MSSSSPHSSQDGSWQSGSAADREAEEAVHFRYLALASQLSVLRTIPNRQLELLLEASRETGEALGFENEVILVAVRERGSPRP